MSPTEHQGDTITVQLPRLEDFAEDLDRASRAFQAAELAGELTPEAFADWMQLGQAIKEGKEVPECEKREPAPANPRQGRIGPSVDSREA